MKQQKSKQTRTEWSTKLLSYIQTNITFNQSKKLFFRLKYFFLFSKKIFKVINNSNNRFKSLATHFRYKLNNENIKESRQPNELVIFQEISRKNKKNLVSKSIKFYTINCSCKLYHNCGLFTKIVAYLSGMMQIFHKNL